MQLNPTYMIPLVLSSKKSRPATSSSCIVGVRLPNSAILVAEICWSR